MVQDGVVCKPLTVHLDDRGFLFEILRSDDACFSKFGQVYVSSVLPGVVKGFHKHFVQTDYVACVQGQIKLVLVSGDSEVKEYHLGLLSPKLVVIPPGVYHGWKCISAEPALVVNVISEVFNPLNPDEERLDPHDNPWGYSWETVDR